MVVVLFLVSNGIVVGVKRLLPEYRGLCSRTEEDCLPCLTRLANKRTKKSPGNNVALHVSTHVSTASAFPKHVGRHAMAMCDDETRARLARLPSHLADRLLEREGQLGLLMLDTVARRRSLSAIQRLSPWLLPMPRSCSLVSRAACLALLAHAPCPAALVASHLLLSFQCILPLL